MTGLTPGVDAITASPLDNSFETAFAKIQVANGPGDLLLNIVSTDDPIVLRVSDLNSLPYQNIAVNASVSDGSLDAAAASSDAQGRIVFRWTPGSNPTSVFTASIDNGPTLTVTLGSQ